MIHALGMAHKTQYQSLHGGYMSLKPESKKPSENWAFCLIYLGWLMGLEPTTTGITILDSTN